jgi:hypothetical protein
VLSLVIVCGCFALAGKPSLAEFPQQAPSINFKHPSCLTQGIAPLKLGYDGVPKSAKEVWWYIVVNFNEVTSQEQGQRVKSCLRVGAPGKEKIAKAGDCEIIGDVRIRRGVAHFNGGYLACGEINVGDARERIGIPAPGDIKEAQELWMAVRGEMSSLVTDTVPLIRYEPTILNSAGAVGFNVTPVSNTLSGAFIVTSSPSERLAGPGLRIGIRPSSAFTGLFVAQPDKAGALTYHWYLGSRLINAIPVSASFTPIWIGEGRFYIGGLPTGERYRGTLDVVAFDPKGGGTK